MVKPTALTPPRVAVLAAALIGLGVTLFAAAAVQQNYRQSANDPQVQLAEDAAARLNAGAIPDQIAPPDAGIDIHASLAPFYVIIDHENHLLATNGKLDGRAVQPPAGTLTADHRFTWQPAPGTRLAAVVEPYYDGYVVVARNLREVEAREDSLRIMALFTLLGVAAVSAVAWLLVR